MYSWLCHPQCWLTYWQCKQSLIGILIPGPSYISMRKTLFSFLDQIPSPLLPLWNHFCNMKKPRSEPGGTEWSDRLIWQTSLNMVKLSTLLFFYAIPIETTFAVSHSVAQGYTPWKFIQMRTQKEHLKMGCERSSLVCNPELYSIELYDFYTGRWTQSNIRGLGTKITLFN